MLRSVVLSAVLVLVFSSGIFGQNSGDKFLKTQFKIVYNGDALSGVRIDGKPNTFGLPSVRDFLKKYSRSVKDQINYSVTYINTECSTLYDICSNGSAVEIWQDPTSFNDIHAVFMTAPLGDGLSFPNRRSKYYYCIGGTIWLCMTDVPSGIRSGFPVITGFSDRTLLIANHSTDGGGVLRSQAYKNTYPGSDVFNRYDAPGNTGYEWPVVIATNNLSLANKFVMISSLKDYDTTRYNVCTNVSSTPGTWLGWNTMQSEQSGACAIARDGSGKIGVAYINDNARFPSSFGDVWLIESTDNGLSFSSPLKIYDAKFEYSDDTLGAFKSISMVYVQNTPCVVFETVRQNELIPSFYPDAPAEIRFWSSVLPGSDPNKSVVIADSSSVGFHPYVGVNDLMAPLCRPSIGTSFDESKLYVAFSVPSGIAGGSVDSTSYMDLWFTHSNTYGLTWAPPSKINPSSPVKDWRYPSVSPKSDNYGSDYFCNLVVLKGHIPGSYINGSDNGQSMEEFWFLRITVSGTPQGPQAPVLISPANNSTGVSISPLFDWSDVSGVSYNIQVAANSTFETPLFYITGLTGSGYQTGSGALLPNSTYYWRVSSTNIQGTGPWSGTWNFTTLGVPAAPSLVSPVNGSTIYTYTPLLDWNDAATAVNYTLQIATDSNFASPILSSGTSVSQFTVHPGILIANVFYYWRARGENGSGSGPWSVKWRFKIFPNGLYQTSSEVPKEFRLYENFPNPFNPSTTIKFDIPKSSAVRLSVYDMTGKEIETLVNEQLAAGTYETKWDGAKFSSGIYFYVITVDNGQTVSKKLILMK